MAKKVTFNIDKKKDFSTWYTEIVKEAELADLRYNVKGFLVFQPMSVLAMEKMYEIYEKKLQEKGHLPYWYPSVIPSSNFLTEKEHVEGFSPDVFWVTEYGNHQKLEEPLALRPTSETAFYQMFSLWLRSYKDMPFKTYQRAQVWRNETKATRPFIRSREFYWIEAHNAFSSLKEAEKQVKEDMETAKEVLHDRFGIPFLFFKRPQWDKFPGAVNTYAADALMPDGKVLQQPSTHLLGQNFSKAFDVKFKDKKGKDQYAFITCYGPAISRIFASMISIHGDNNGLVFPFEVAPFQIIIIPILLNKNDKEIIRKAKSLQKKLSKKYRVHLDLTDNKFGEKFYQWEMKGIPVRIEIGPKELSKNEVILFRRDTKTKKNVKINLLQKEIEKTGKDLTKNLIEKADKEFKNNIISISSLSELKKMKGKFAHVDFCSIDKDGEKCAAKIEKEGLEVRGTRIDVNEKPKGKCIVCGKEAKIVVYIAKSY